MYLLQYKIGFNSMSYKLYLKMASTGIGFRWLDILEKEFDTNFVDLDTSLAELEAEEPDIVCTARHKMTALSSCFAQLTHKAQTIFQNSAKVEAELVDLRTELIDAKTKKECLEHELRNVVVELHTAQLVNKLPSNHTGDKNISGISSTTVEPQEVCRIRKKLQEEYEKSPSNHHVSSTTQDDTTIPQKLVALRQENAQLQNENSALRNSILALHSEVYGARLAAKYLDKELAGRIQQLQLLGKEMRGDVKDKLWRQLESEILLQRHKTVVRACRRNNHVYLNGNSRKTSDATSLVPTTDQGLSDIRMVTVKRNHGQGLGISITGGREHGVPILISELEPNGPAALSEQLFIGDAILTVNGIDLKQACHKEAVHVLQQQTGDCVLMVQYIAAEDSDTNSLSEDGYNFQYRFFDTEVCDSNDVVSLHPLQQGTGAMANTPTAPRTPDYNEQSRNNSDDNRSDSSCPNSPQNELSQQIPKIDRSKECQVNLTQPNSITITINDNENNNCYQNKVTQEIIEIPTEITETKVSNLDNFSKEHERFFENNCTIIHIEETPSDIKNGNYDSNLNHSTNSLLYTTESDNASSPIQNSTDHFMSSDIFSNNSDSPKSFVVQESSPPSTAGKTSFVVKNFKTELYEPKVFRNNVVEFTEKKMDSSYSTILDSPPELSSNFSKNGFGDNESTTSDYVTDTVLGMFENITTNVLNDNFDQFNAEDPRDGDKTHLTNLLELQKFQEFCKNDETKNYSSNSESFSNNSSKSGRSFNASCFNESYESSPIHRQYTTDTSVRRSTRKLKNRKSHGVKTIQSIFRANDYLSSDISSANSDLNEDTFTNEQQKLLTRTCHSPNINVKRLNKALKHVKSIVKDISSDEETSSKLEKGSAFPSTAGYTYYDLTSEKFNSARKLVEFTPEFNKNIHTFLSETFGNTEVQLPNLKIINSVQKLREKSPKPESEDAHEKDCNVEPKRTNYVEGFLNQTEPRVITHQLSQESEYSDDTPVELVQYGRNLNIVNQDLISFQPDGKNTDPVYIDEKRLKENKEKLLERYVRANQNLLNIEGNGDPDFGTPV